jgi:UDP-2,3-diacylglucosamine pyrophosphatase LpxH
MRRRVFVLSDLHLGPGGSLTTFHEAERLCALLKSWKDGERIDELILSGDIFDFLQLEGYDGFDSALSVTRFEEIARNPQTRAVLDGLQSLAERPGVEITVLSGNHDPEMLADDVRDAFEGAIQRRGSVRWADDAPLIPRNGKILPVWGRAVHLAGDEANLERQVWVVHGDRWDPSNIIDRDAVRAATKAKAAVSLPLGSHLVFEVLSKIKRHHRWVDELKPELPAVVPLLLAIAPKEMASYLSKHFEIPARLLVAHIRAWLGKGPTMKTGEAPTTEETMPSLVAEVIAAELQRGTQIERNLFLGQLEPFLDSHPTDSSGAPLLGPTTGVRGVLLRAWLRAVRSRDRFGDLAGDDSTPKHAGRVVPPGLSALVAGHTHGARIRGDLRPRYFNSGTWMPVRTLEGDLDALLASLTAPHIPTPSPGTFVRIDLGDEQPEITVDAAPKGLAK